MDFTVRSLSPLQQPRSQLRKGWVYTRHSLRFEILHPIVFGLVLLQIVLSTGLLMVAFAIIFFHYPSFVESGIMIATVTSYFFTSITTVVLTATVAAYVLAAKLGVSHPLSQAISQVRQRLPALITYALVWSAIVTVITGFDWLVQRGVVTEPLNTVFQALVFVLNLGWGFATLFVIPILVFEPTMSLGGAIRRSTAFLRESILCILVFWIFLFVLFFAIVSGGIVVFFLTTGLIALLTPVIAFLGAILFCFTLNIVFNSLLYGEVAGPLNASQSQ